MIIVRFLFVDNSSNGKWFFLDNNLDIISDSAWITITCWGSNQTLIYKRIRVYFLIFS